MQNLFSLCFLYALEYGRIQDFISPVWAYLLNGDSCYHILEGVSRLMLLTDFAKAGISCIVCVKRCISFTIDLFGDKSVSPPPRLPENATAGAHPSSPPLISGSPDGPIKIFNSPGGVINIIYSAESIKNNIPHANAR